MFSGVFDPGWDLIIHIDLQLDFFFHLIVHLGEFFHAIIQRSVLFFLFLHIVPSMDVPKFI